MKLTKQQVQADIDALPENYKTKDVDALIKRCVKAKADVSVLRDYVLKEQQFHRIYFYVMLEQIKDVREQMGKAWLIAELAVYQPKEVYDWLQSNDLLYNINGKAIQKICDSFRVSDEWKNKYKALRPMLKERT